MRRLVIACIGLWLTAGLVTAAEPAAHETKAAPAAAPAPSTPHAAHGEAAQGLDGKQALALLLEGNRRFVADLMSKQHKDTARRIEVAKGQHPLAIVLCCADSRVPPEQVFDVGLGDIFVVRVAGNVLDDVVLGSVEYAASHLHAPLVVVLGHERCGAVSASISGDPAPAHVLAIVDRIQANLAGSAPGPGDALDQAVCLNARTVARQLAAAQPLLGNLVSTGALTVVAARYDLDDGTVALLP